MKSEVLVLFVLTVMTLSIASASSQAQTAPSPSVKTLGDLGSTCYGDCKSGLLCVNNKCVSDLGGSCSKPSDCDSGQCDVPSNTCVKRCTSDAQCDNLQCEKTLGICVHLCKYDDQCKVIPGATCVNMFSSNIKTGTGLSECLTANQDKQIASKMAAEEIRNQEAKRLAANSKPAAPEIATNSWDRFKIWWQGLNSETQNAGINLEIKKSSDTAKGLIASAEPNALKSEPTQVASVRGFDWGKLMFWR